MKGHTVTGKTDPEWTMLRNIVVKLLYFRDTERLIRHRDWQFKSCVGRENQIDIMWWRQWNNACNDLKESVTQWILSSQTLIPIKIAANDFEIFKEYGSYKPFPKKLLEKKFSVNTNGIMHQNYCWWSLNLRFK